MKTSTITEKTIDHLAKLANLPLTDANKKDFKTKLASVVSYVGEVQKIDLTGLSETAQVTGKVNELREDEVESSFTQQEALSQTNGQVEKGYFVVPQVISHE